MSRISANKFNLTTIEQTKISLSKYDDKRYILDNGIDCVPHGYYN